MHARLEHVDVVCVEEAGARPEYREPVIFQIAPVACISKSFMGEMLRSMSIIK